MSDFRFPLAGLFRSLLVGFVFSISGAAADEIPEDLLMMDYYQCMEGCLDVSGQTSCEILCGCSMSQFRSNLDAEGYNELLGQMSRDEVTPENRTFLDDTANLCVAELDRLFEESLLDMPEEVLPSEPEGD